MKNQDRSTKVLLGLLVLGVWGSLLKPLVSTSVEAQPGIKPPTRMKTATKPKTPADGRVVMVVSDPGTLLMESHANFVSQINGYESKGYRIAGYQTSVERNVTYHYALLERK